MFRDSYVLCIYVIWTLYIRFAYPDIWLWYKMLNFIVKYYRDFDEFKNCPKQCIYIYVYIYLYCFEPFLSLYIYNHRQNGIVPSTMLLRFPWEIESDRGRGGGGSETDRSIDIHTYRFGLVWFYGISKHCRLFNAKSIYIHINSSF